MVPGAPRGGWEPLKMIVDKSCLFSDVEQSDLVPSSRREPGRHKMSKLLAAPAASRRPKNFGPTCLGGGHGSQRCRRYCLRLHCLCLRSGIARRQEESKHDFYFDRKHRVRFDILSLPEQTSSLRRLGLPN